MTSDLPRRIEQHKTGDVPGFTKRYGIRTLVWFESFDDIREAIAREKAMKKWLRAWKVRLVEESNPNWDELHPW